MHSKMTLASLTRHIESAIPKALLLFFASAGLTAACSDDDDQIDGNTVDSFLIALEATLDIECECRQTPSQNCSNAKQSLRQCVNSALSTEQMASQQFPRCAAQTIRDYNACLRTRGSCGADGVQGVEACDSAIDASTCQLPQVLAPCFSGEAPAPGETPVSPDTPTNPVMPVGPLNPLNPLNPITPTTPSNPSNPMPDPPDPEGSCSESCDFFDDGECDDGGPGSETDLCELGTDCTDCGPR